MTFEPRVMWGGGGFGFEMNLDISVVTFHTNGTRFMFLLWVCSSRCGVKRFIVIKAAFSVA